MFMRAQTEADVHYMSCWSLVFHDMFAQISPSAQKALRRAVTASGRLAL